MPIRTRTETVEVPDSHVCDVCGEEDHNFFNDFVLRHTLGFGSPLDETEITAAICDDCLTRIVLENIPGAIFRDGNETLSHDDVRARLARNATPVEPGNGSR